MIARSKALCMDEVIWLRYLVEVVRGACESRTDPVSGRCAEL